MRIEPADILGDDAALYLDEPALAVSPARVADEDSG
jgi:hypothetical protein